MVNPYTQYTTNLLLIGGLSHCGKSTLATAGDDFLENEFTSPVIFEKLTPSRQKDTKNYLNYQKTEDALVRNIEKVIKGLSNPKK